MGKTFKLTITVIVAILITSCGFNSKDDTAWKKKLCEGYWEDNSVVNDLNKKIIANFKFNINGTFDLNFRIGNDYNKQYEGTWKLERYSGWEQEKIIREQEIIVNFSNKSFYGYDQFAMQINYVGDHKFEIEESSVILEGRTCRLKHYAIEGKLIDQ